MYTIVIFTGINNCATVMNFIATERNVFYRETFARMYSPWAYSFSQVLVEVPYSLLQSLICTIIVLSYDRLLYLSLQSVLELLLRFLLIAHLQLLWNAYGCFNT